MCITKIEIILIKKNWKCGTGIASTKLVFVNFMVCRGDQGSVTSPLYKNDLCIFEGLLCSR
jgi:hypothetical protein